MEREDWREYLKKEREKYKKIGPIKCPAFNNEEIYFNRYGFDHTVYKDGIPRPMDEVVKRFGLLPYVPNILKNLKSVDNEEKRTKDKSTAYFWTIKHQIHSNLRIRIIVRRLKGGMLHFFSIMKE